MEFHFTDYLWLKLVVLGVAASIYGFRKGLKGKRLDDPDTVSPHRPAIDRPGYTEAERSGKE